MDNLSELIARKRIESGLTQENLAKLSDVNRTTIRRYERGDFKNIDFRQLHNISLALNFNLLTYMLASCEGLSVNSYLKIKELYHFIATAQKTEVETFLLKNTNDVCFKSHIGRELYYFARSLLYYESRKFDFAIDTCSLGLDINIRTQMAKNLQNKSIIYLKLLNLAASCMGELGNCSRSMLIYNQIYDFISNIHEAEKCFSNYLFYEDFFDFKIVTLCNMTHLLNSNGSYMDALKACNEAIRISFENSAYKYFFYLVFNKALALYNMKKYGDAKNALLKIYEFYFSTDNYLGINQLKKLIPMNFPEIISILDQMSNSESK